MKPHSSLLFAHMVSSAALGIGVLLCTSAVAQGGRFSVSADQQQVTDQSTGLVWRRCEEGLRFEAGACLGTALSFMHESALIRARTVATESGQGWRVPNVKELGSLIDRARRSPAVDTAFFPSTSSDYYWSSTPNVVIQSSAWWVNFASGEISNSSRLDSFRLRLVR